MKKILFLFVFFMSGFFVFSEEVVSEKALKQIIGVIDQIQNFTNYLIDMEITTKKGDNGEYKLVGKSLFRSFGESILVIKFPEKDRGKGVLQKDSLYYIYFPSIGKTQPVNPTSKLFGDFNTSDVLKPPYADNYNAEYKGEKDNLTVIEFTAKLSTLPYQKQVMYFDMKNNEVRIIELYSKTDKLLKKAYYDKYTVVDNKKFVTSIRIESVMGSVSVMNFKKWVKMEFANNYFTPAGLSIAATSF